MTLVCGVILGIGLFLVLSSLLWRTHPGGSLPRGRVLLLMRERLAQAGLARVGIVTVAVVSLILAVASSALVLALVPVTAVAVAAGLFAVALPSLAIVWRARGQRRATRVLWPDAVDHLVSAVRSGLALPDSVVTLAHTGPELTRAAFSEFEKEYRASGNFSDALDRLKDRLMDPVADRIIETLRMSREVGGNELTRVLRNLASYLRQDASIRQEVAARQSWIVNAARLGVGAPWVVLLMLSTRPAAAAAYNSPPGGLVIAVGLAVSVVAYRLMIGLGRLPEERRWFA
jgi:tight adherence protein B